MRILIATPEAVPYAKTGGLADVAGALIKKYRDMKKEAYIILPLYRKIKKGDVLLKNTGLKIKVPIGDREIEGGIFSGESLTYFIDCDEFFDREELYGTPQGDYIDNASRFIFFSRGVLETCKALNFKPDVIHCNEWQTGLIPLYLKTIYRLDKFFKDTATMLTIHNLGYQGLFPASEMPLTGLGWELFNPEGIEFYGRINFLKAGLVSADVLTTVSYTYAKEILKKESGFGLEGVLQRREKDLYGVINGIDYKEWDPSKDRFLPKNFDIKNLQGKRECKRRLVKEVSLDKLERPFIGMITRLSAQKGLDLVLQSIEELLSLGVNLILLGKGEEAFHIGFSEVANRYKGRVSVTIGFEEPLAHRIYAGSDFFLTPSRYEPCGLGQLISMRYGSIPIGRRTGGLVDTIQDYDPLTSKGTGFLFSDHTPSAMLDAVKRALCVYTDKDKMQRIIVNAMKMDFSWKRSAERYIELYDYVTKKRKGMV
ncbi:MAG: glycogen synthase GlgA [Thermodesulfovibrionales bacterium]|nr:glycogen synthase GlgA [Thermodesulfovibrionales bacterium]